MTRMRPRISDATLDLAAQDGHSDRIVVPFARDLLDARARIKDLHAVARAAAALLALEHDVALKSGVEMLRMMAGETLYVQVGGEHPLTTVRRELRAALDAPGARQLDLTA